MRHLYRVDDQKNSTVENILNRMKQGLPVASAAHAYSYDKEGMLRFLLEDK